MHSKLGIRGDFVRGIFHWHRRQLSPEHRIALRRRRRRPDQRRYISLYYIYIFSTWAERQVGAFPCSAHFCVRSEFVSAHIKKSRPGTRNNNHNEASACNYQHTKGAQVIANSNQANGTSAKNCTHWEWLDLLLTKVLSLHFSCCCILKGSNVTNLQSEIKTIKKWPNYFNPQGISSHEIPFQGFVSIFPGCL
jgi:hypothetical protein